MELTINNIVDLNSIYEFIKTQKMSIQTTYKFSKLFKQVAEEYQFYTSELEKIISNYGERDDDGNLVPLDNGYKLRQDSISIAQQELINLLNLQVKFSDIKFEIEELKDLELTVEQFNCLLPFINE